MIPIPRGHIVGSPVSAVVSLPRKGCVFGVVAEDSANGRSLMEAVTNRICNSACRTDLSTRKVGSVSTSLGKMAVG